MCRNILLELQLLVQSVVGLKQEAMLYFRPVKFWDGSLTVSCTLLAL